MAVGEEMFMSRKMSSVVAVLAFLSLSAAGPVQASVAFHLATPSGVLLDLSLWASSGLASVLAKDGIGLDPNGGKHQGARRAPGFQRPAGRLVSKS
jgi:hypothetical protein